MVAGGLQARAILEGIRDFSHLNPAMDAGRLRRRRHEDARVPGFAGLDGDARQRPPQLDGRLRGASSNPRTPLELYGVLRCAQAMEGIRAGGRRIGRAESELVAPEQWSEYDPLHFGRRRTVERHPAPELERERKPCTGLGGRQIEYHLSVLAHASDERVPLHVDWKAGIDSSSASVSAEHESSAMVGDDQPHRAFRNVGEPELARTSRHPLEIPEARIPSVGGEADEGP